MRRDQLFQVFRNMSGRKYLGADCQPRFSSKLLPGATFHTPPKLLDHFLAENLA